MSKFRKFQFIFRILLVVLIFVFCAYSMELNFEGYLAVGLAGAVFMVMKPMILFVGCLVFSGFVWYFFIIIPSINGFILGIISTFLMTVFFPVSIDEMDPGVVVDVD